MEIKNFRSFKKIAELKSFTKAASELGYAQSTLTFQIQAIEQYYNRPLFERLGKNIELTSFGKELLDELEVFLSDYEKLEQLAYKEKSPKGTLRIGTAESLMMYRLYPIIKEYKEKYPKVDIVIVFDQCESLRQKLISGELDVSFVLQPDYSNSENLIAITLKEEQMCLVAPSEQEGEDFLPTDAQMILFTEKECTYRQELNTYLKSKNFCPTNILETGSVEAIKKCIKNGLGVSYLPYYSIEEEVQNKVFKAKVYDSGVKLYTQLAYHKNKWINPALKALIDLSIENKEKWK